MTRLVFFALALGFVSCSCAPDLKVTHLDVVWGQDAKKARAEIANEGTKDAGEFLVHFDGVENPVSDNYRPHISVEVPGLPKGEWLPLDADFTPLARAENNFLGRVYKIRVTVDPKRMVKESNENNNSLEQPIP